KIIVDFGDRPDRRSRAPARGLLFDRNRWREPIDAINLRFGDLPKKLPGVAGERFHVPALALGIDRVNRQGAFSGSAGAAGNSHGVARQRGGDVFQIVLGSAIDRDLLDRCAIGAGLANWLAPPLVGGCRAVFAQSRSQRLTRIRALATDDLFGSPGGNEIAAL